MVDFEFDGPSEAEVMHDALRDALRDFRGAAWRARHDERVNAHRRGDGEQGVLTQALIHQTSWKVGFSGVRVTVRRPARHPSRWRKML